LPVSRSKEAAAPSSADLTPPGAKTMISAAAAPEVHAYRSIEKAKGKIGRQVEHRIFIALSPYWNSYCFVSFLSAQPKPRFLVSKY
jgi:hypothetical protein